MNENMPRLSVIVPIFNAENYLEQCIKSILGQTLEELEILLINDGSTDESLSIIQHYASLDNRIRIIDKQNQGYGATCNRGLKEATGEYVAIVEPDDWIESGMYKDMVDFAGKFSNTIDIIKTPYWRIWLPDTDEQRKLRCSYCKRIKPKKQPFTIDDPGAVHLLRHHPSIWSAIYRREFLNKSNLCFKEIPGAGWADNPFLIETLCLAKTIVYLEKPYYCYREETPEKTRQFVLNNTMLPFERWNDMMDIIENLEITNQKILEAHNSRGFTYLNGVTDQVGLSHDEVWKAASQMFRRMDAELVLNDPEISPSCKELFCRLNGMPSPKINRMPYYWSLIKQGFYDLKNLGLQQTAFATKNYFTKQRARMRQQT